MKVWTWIELSQVYYQDFTSKVRNPQQVVQNAQNSTTSCANISFSKGTLFQWGCVMKKWHLNMAELEEIII
jgi:hypothetical protein